MGKKLLKTHKVNLENAPIEFNWYTIKVNFNYEQAAADNILKGAAGRGFKDYFKDVITPIIEVEEEVIDKKGIKKIKKRRKKVYGYDGYIWVNMILTTETWSIVRNATGVTGWLNMDGRPLALGYDDVINIKKACGLFEKEKINRVENFNGEVGDLVEILDGPMKGLGGVILSIDKNKNTVQIEADNGFKLDTELHQVKIS